MSNQYKAGVVTNLEQVFLSREFARTLDRRALFHDRARGTGLEALEQAPRSDHFGGRRDRLLHVTEAAGASQAALWPENAVSRVLPFGLRENNRSRAIAAMSGIAAAALVVAGLASGGAQQRLGSVSAQGPRTGSHSGPGGHAGSPAGLSPGPAGASGTLAASSGSSGARHAFLTGQTAHTATGQPTQAGQSGQPPTVTVEVPPGTTVTLVTSPAAPQTGPTGTGTGGATSSPSPTPPAPSNPTTPVVVVVGNTVTTVGSAVTNANHVGSDVPTVAPTTVAPATGALGAVGASVTGLTQNLNSTTA